MKIEELYNISNSLTILYVEDNEIIGLKVLEYLSKIFRDVVWEKDGISGFNKFKSQDFDIVVTDIYIPKLDGIEMLKKIKEIKPTQSCVIISEYKEPNCFIESIKLGVDEYILKPIEYEQMNKSFETLLSKINQTKLVQQYQTNLEQLIQEQTNDLMLFKKAIDSTAEGVVITKANDDQPAIYVNKAFEDITGYKENSILGENLRVLNRLSTNKKEISDIADAITNKTSIQTTLKNHTKNGKEFINKLTIDPICDNSGEVTHFIGIQEDISESKKQEFKLKQSAKIFENIKEGIILTNENGVIIDVNNAFCDITAFSYDEAIGQKPSLLKSGIHDELFYSDMWKTIDDTKHWSGQIYNRKKTGEIYTSFLNISAIKDENNRIKYVGVFTDITKVLEYEKNLREKDIMLVQQSKMAAMGEMIDSIAHQWKQPLSIVSTTVSLLEVKSDFDDLQKDDIYSASSEIINAVKYMSDTIDDFKNFFSPHKLKTYFYIEKTVEKVLKLLNLKYRKNNVKVVSDIEPLKLYTYENELVQVLLNILNNAADAFKTDASDENLVFITIKSVNNKTYIDIKDNAGGIPDDIINRVFEARFTTKHNSNGTGIGLYMSKKIIEQSMEGDIKVENNRFTHNSNNYKGACFSISY